MLRKNLHAIIGSAQDTAVDVRILNAVGFGMGVAGVLAAIVSFWPLKSGSAMIYPCVIGSAAGFLSWYLSRYHRLVSVSFVLLLTTQLLALMAVFLFNGGIYGPSSFFFVTWVPVYLFALRRFQAAMATLLFFLTFTGLFWLQRSGAIEPVNYSNNPDRAIDLYAGFFFNFILTVVIALSVKAAFRAAREKIQASSQAKTLFLANISHEIRTPMNAILGMTELALSRSSDPQQKQWLETSQVATQHLLNLMEDMLDISSIDEGKLAIVHRPFRLREAIAGSANLLREVALQKQLQLDVSFSLDVPDLVESDPLRLRQVLVNLLNNAIKFTDEGGVFLHVSTEGQCDQPDCCQLLFRIQDTGLGIPEDQQQRVFEIFTQGNNIDVLRHKGFGLGLSISRRLVEKMGGRIWLDSAPGQGSIFYFCLPVRVLAPTHPVTPDRMPDTDTRLPILLAEDNATNIDVATHMLKQKGFSIDIAMDGQQALARLAAQKYAVVLMDLEMPVMDGFEATRALRSGLAGSLNQHTPVIAVTAHALAEYREKALATGMQGFVTKPIHITVLIDTITKTLST